MLSDISWAADNYCDHPASKRSSNAALGEQSKVFHDFPRSYKLGISCSGYQRSSFLVDCSAAQVVDIFLLSFLASAN